MSKTNVKTSDPKNRQSISNVEGVRRQCIALVSEGSILIFQSTDWPEPVLRGVVPISSLLFQMDDVALCRVSWQ